MKSRYEVLKSESERRGLAIFRSSAAVAVLVGVVVLGAQVGPQSPGASVDEVFAVQPTSVVQEPVVAVRAAAPAPAAIASPEEAAVPPRYQGEPSVY